MIEQFFENHIPRDESTPEKRDAWQRIEQAAARVPRKENEQGNGNGDYSSHSLERTEKK